MSYPAVTEVTKIDQIREKINLVVSVIRQVNFEELLGILPDKFILTSDQDWRLRTWTRILAAVNDGERDLDKLSKLTKDEEEVCLTK